MQGLIKYGFTAEVWMSAPTGGWYIVSLPTEISTEIREHLKWQEEGWGRLKAEAEINSIRWQTAIWFDSNQKTYLLPLKADIRKKLDMQINQSLEVNIFV